MIGNAQPAANAKQDPQAPTAPSPPRFVDHPKVLVALPPPPPGAESPSTDPRNFEGVWLAQQQAFLTGSPPQYTPKAAQEQRHRTEMLAKGTPLLTNAARCRPFSAIAIGGDQFPAEIIQTDQKIVVLQEETRTRWQIFLNRDHPKKLIPSYWGDSVGHWEGNTLVVDTIGFDGQQDDLTPTSHVVSRLRKVDDGQQLELISATTDPNQYLKPLERKSVSAWHPELSLYEFQCEENPEGAREGFYAG